jgi:2-polyprenyl-6-hydroxyphenyl methylase/3-demethylubiquinone-9 3-methyltransferase
VLHHTGQMWRGTDLAARAVRPGGLLFIAIYNDQGRESQVWYQIKQRYNRSGPLGRRLIVAATGVYFNGRTQAKKLVRALSGDKFPAARPVRGMSKRHDLVDWVGGYPFEVAKPEEIFSFLHERGFELRHLKTCGGGLGCNEYVLQRG